MSNRYGVDEYKRRVIDKLLEMVRKQLFRKWDELPEGNYGERMERDVISFSKEKSGFGEVKFEWKPDSSGGWEHFEREVLGFMKFSLILNVD